MSPADFDDQFNRLTGHFHLPVDVSRETVALDWLRAVQGYDAAIVEHAVTTLIRGAQDRFWPPLGRLLDLCRGRASGSDRGGRCPTCAGSHWIDSAPFKSNGMIYENVVIRCSDCGVPAPQYTAPSHRDALTAIEYREWSEGTMGRDYMPEGCQAKPWKSEAARLQHQAEMRAGFEQLRRKLFGRDAA